MQQPYEKPSKGVQLMQLPGEIRSMIWEHALKAGKGFSLAPLDVRWVASYCPWYERWIRKFDCSLLLASKQVHGEAEHEILRKNRIKMDINFIEDSIDTRDPLIKRRLFHILERAADVYIIARGLHPYHWTLTALTARSDLDYLEIIWWENESRLAASWRKDEAQSKQELEHFEDIAVRRCAFLRYQPSSIGSVPYDAWVPTCRSIQRWIDESIVPSMLGKK